VSGGAREDGGAASGPPEVLEVSFARPEALDDPARRAAALALLTDEERERIARFHFERDQRLHLAARALLRRSLSRRAPVPPGAWRFRAGPHGRPEILAPPSPLRFNVSHTRGLAMVAVVARRDVGVDVERIPEAAPLDVVDRCFAPPERAAVRGAPPGEQGRRFAEIWTLKEAYVKARGLGLSLDLGAFAVDPAPPRMVRGADAGEWQLELLAPTYGHRAAVCVRREAGPLHLAVSWDDG
jgi:4'-phosphopantetheinyl transferase